MQSMPTDNNLIREGLNTFIRCYYKSRLIKGSLYATAVLVALFVGLSLSEYFAFFPPVVRAALFWSYLLLFVAAAAVWVLRPLLQMYKVGRVLTYEQAAVIVGEHFPEVSDRLLNLLQLEQMEPTAESDLLAACIEQKTRSLSPIPFYKAVDLRKNRRYVKYAAIPLFLLLVLLLAAPSTIVAPSQRIVDYRTPYHRPAPFAFVIENEELATTANRDYTLQVTVAGNSAPAEVYIQLPQGRYKMHSDDRTHYSYLFNKPRSDISFQLSGGGVTSEKYCLTVHPEAAVVDFRVILSYPAYIHRENEVLMNDGDMTVPRGTQVRWLFQTRDVDTLYLEVEGAKRHCGVPDASGRLSVAWRAMESADYCFFVRNSYTQQSDTLRYSVSVIPDVAPSISVAETVDTTTFGRKLFYGRIHDDYGFSSLHFVVERRRHRDTTSLELERRPIALSAESVQEFYYTVDIGEWTLEPGDRLDYFFEVCDNNAVDGFQCRRSQTFTEEIPTEQELRQQLDSHGRQAEQQARTSMSELQRIQQEIDNMLRQLVDKKELNWQDRQQLQELHERQKEVREALQQMREEMRASQQLQNRFQETSEELMEKQRELDRLMNEVLDDKMKQTMQEMERLLQEVDKKQLQNQLENIQLNNKELEKQIDRDIELMKRLEMEQRVESLVQRIDDLAARQEQLSKKLEQSGKKDSDEMLLKQRELSQQYRELQQEIRAIEREYKKLDERIEFKSDLQLEQSIEQHQQSAEQQMQRGSRRGASQQQRSAAEEMHQLSEKLAEQQQDLEQASLAEDAAMIRKMLKNLVHLSFDQESLMSRTAGTLVQDPLYQDIIAAQSDVRRDFRLVEDSLNAIAHRQIQVAGAIGKEVSDVSVHVAKSLSDLLQYNQSFYAGAKNSTAQRSMQYAMTSINNLALVLAESLDNMQRQMNENQQRKKNGSCKRSGNQSCSNPGQGKTSAKSMKQMQEELNRQLDALKKQLDKQGKSEGKGRKRLGEQNAMSEEFARMAAQQEAIRRMMQQYGQEMKQGNAHDSKMAREIDAMLRQMEQTETDLVNKTITRQTLQRQQQIMSRMLEHERAEMQREKEQRRESREGVDPSKLSPQDLQQFERLRRRGGSEMLRTAPLPLTPFYKSKVDEYLFR